MKLSAVSCALNTECERSNWTTWQATAFKLWYKWLSVATAWLQIFVDSSDPYPRALYRHHETTCVHLVHPCVVIACSTIGFGSHYPRALLAIKPRLRLHHRWRCALHLRRQHSPASNSSREK
jgi:hypothetical protein